MFRALMVDSVDGKIESTIREIDEAQLPPGDVTIDVEYSSLNYKDGLAVTGKGKIIRGAMPFVPGIDLAGTVASSDSPAFKRGDRVLVTGWGSGEKQWGGYAAKARVKSEWVIAIPDELTTRQSMTLGTAGLTAMLSLLALEDHGLKRGEGEVVVTGATGGVGSIAIALLARGGYRAVASTGSGEARDYLERIGATRIIDRAELPSAAPKALDSAKWSGAIDTVGGPTLAGIIAQLATHASVASCGNAASAELQTTVYPFILRGVNLLGIDSNTAPTELRKRAWHRLATDMSKQALETIESGVVTLDELPEKCAEITEGKVNGRIVVDVNSMRNE